MAKKRTSRRRRVPKWRIEQDSMGKMKVPSWALWGASTQRAKDNFPVSGRVVPVEVVHAFGLLKEACARANMELKRISGPKGRTIVRAAQAVAEGELDDHFVVDVFQTGSGTSTNMNANEVIANYASLEAGEEVGSKRPVHPNDHVNMGQSSNDTFPTAMHVAAALSLANDLKPALERMQEELAARAEEWDDITKIGRTHLMDATPIRVGQVFGGYAEQMAKAMERCDVAIEALSELAIGVRSEERRVGKECSEPCRSRWSPYH